MNLISFEANITNGDVGFLFTRDQPNADNLLIHRTNIPAGYTDYLENGFAYTDGSMKDDNPVIQYAQVPAEVQAYVKSLWATAPVVATLAAREEEAKNRATADAAAAAKAEEDAKAIKDAKAKEISDAVDAALKAAGVTPKSQK